MSERFTREQVSQHNDEKSAWVIIDNRVFDVTKFAKFHPGGHLLLLEYAGQDVTEKFYELHRHSDLQKYQRLIIGQVTESDQRPLTAPDLEITKDNVLSQVPFAEPSALMGFHSPYYNETHRNFRVAVREFLMKNVYDVAEKSDLADKGISQELYKKIADFGITACRIGPGPHLHIWEKMGGSLPGGVKAAEFDYFHEMICNEEIARIGMPAFNESISSGMVIGLPPVALFAKSPLKERVVKECITGEEQIVLAITEPFAGSDVAQIKTTAKLSDDGKHYIVNGVKKWITGSAPAKYFTTAVRTGGEGMGGISMLLIERGPGVTTKLLKTSYGSASGTSYIIFENVKVPVENLIGKENKGFQVIMYNFNHERLSIVAIVNAGMRSMVRECFLWANQRKVFGKSLLQQPVIRFRMAKMIALTESIQNWMENIIFQMNKMKYSEQAKMLGGPIAMMKYQTTRNALAVADHACQIFGGRSLTKTGMGKYVERYYRAVKFGAILGGSEFIVADLGVRQAMRQFPERAKL